MKLRLGLQARFLLAMALVLLVVLVYLIQFCGDRIVRAVSHK